MSEQKKPNDAEEILSEFQKSQNPKTESEEIPKESISESIETPESAPEPELISQSEPEPTKEPETQPREVKAEEDDGENPGGGSNLERNVIFVGVKPIMTYVTATLTQLAAQPTVTIKARGKRITQAVDVSQMIVKRMDTVGYVVSDVRIASDSLTSQDGKQRNVSTIEIDITIKK
ncbi:MAG: DNA-binding protein [Crenarchaeota archaeon]|nr:MAG: DNA-binding protein [Thermoproteota archaeon]RDJ33867.1 MAG: DNA-binding protein [Thermoproteota archaeon]RDJ37022.1 MAG: DNA-binding protein [Thermoproteota archaeon]RDJ37443.1 MAG: DNA-binding protein [Thermoproteota archaeon]